MADRPFSTVTIPSGTRIACRIEYDGSPYSGWQAQASQAGVTVQGELEKALSCVANEPVRVHCAGRTDSGVHGYGQIVHFDAPVARSAKSWIMGTNAALPDDVRVHWARAVSSEFHARFSAQARRYRYLIANTPVRPALLVGKVAWHHRPLDAAAMHQAAQCLLGERDFSAFRAAACQSSTPMRRVHRVRVSRREEFVIIEIQANAFLHHMVRNIAGSLIAVGDSRRPVAWLAELLEGRDRTAAADTAPASGLYLVDVEYSSQFSLPATPAGPNLLS